ncbi:MAG: DUF354 domain-containing protein [Saprospiraceae bacterium]|nr:DUF354 domain-containing protein [Saprospiraceae bacterium]
MKIWFDITNTPHVHFFVPLIRHLQIKHEVFVTARDFSETLPLLEKNNISYILIGNHKGKSKVKKVLGLVNRIISLLFIVPKFDISVSIGGQITTPVSFIRGKPSLVFTDNDTSYKYHSYKLGSYFIFPSYFDCKSVMDNYKVKRSQIFTYNGFKEDVYIAGFSPDEFFLNQIPFENFITIRPENLKASYVPTDAVSIVPELFKEFENENILFLPRYKEEEKYAEGYSNIFIPKSPLSGLDVCYHTKAMLTGAGTFAREAALLGTPAVSFFPGKVFLTVDIIMQQKGWEFKSRNTSEIKEYVDSVQRKDSQTARSKDVLKEVLEILDAIIDKFK